MVLLSTAALTLTIPSGALFVLFVVAILAPLSALVLISMQVHALRIIMAQIQGRQRLLQESMHRLETLQKNTPRTARRQLRRLRP